MNWNHLLYFQRIAELQSFTLAANSLYISPAALSKAIRNLERHLGFPLFKKQGRNSVLTEYGVLFYKHISSAFAEVDKGLQCIYDRVNLVKGLIKISGNWTMCGGFLPERINAFRTLHPEVTYFMKYLLSSEVIQSVLSNKSDLGFCGDYDISESNHSELERKLLYKEDLVMISPKNHWLAGQDYVNFSQLKEEDFISFQTVNAGGIYEALLELCDRHEFRPKIVFEANDDHVIVALVAAGMGVALVPHSKYLPLDNVAITAFRENAPVRHQYIIWRKNDYIPPVAKAFRDFIISTTRSSGSISVTS